MTHTLHRRGDRKSLIEDYVLLARDASGFNDKTAPEKLQKIFEIISHYKVVNYGTSAHGNMHTTTLDKLMKAKSRIAHAVFQDRETLLACLREIKENDLGISVVVSGLYDSTVQCCNSLGLKPHTVNLSLGIHGALEKLPPPDVLEIITMCGHALVSPALVESLVQEVKANKRTVEEASIELSRLCDCGIFNPLRAAKVLRRLSAYP
jgi:hypothetical protein